ncbi:MAG: hypothetical protein ABIO79_14105 [Ferruginibacter sp.]
MQRKKEYHSNAHTFLRPASFCAEMIASGLSFNEIRLRSEGNFKKSFRNEIENVTITDNKDNLIYGMDMVINRDGIYDRLPEGIFHQTKGNSKTLTTTQMTEEYRLFREEEKLARKFFQPFEQEFFRYSTMVEQEELNLAFGILNGTLKNELFSFWGIPNGLPDAPVRKLVQILPWLKGIKGNIEQTAKALELVLNKPVRHKESSKKQHTLQAGSFGLGLGELGVDTVSGSSFWEPSPCWTFFIEEIKKNEIESYRDNSPHGKLLKHFEEIFIPLQIDIIFEYAVLPAEDLETEDVLGLSLVL